MTTDGPAKCWGVNLSGQLGNGTFTTSEPLGSATPGDVSTLTSGALQISAGIGHTCAVTSDGGAKCWGGHGSGLLGDGTFAAGAGLWSWAR